jgi:regulation of enolase protein 1 (concanavalin A-like superfamily)
MSSKKSFLFVVALGLLWLASPTIAALNAQNPDPADGAVNVVLALMVWTPGAGAVSHDVYFGTDPQPPLVSAKQAAPVYFSPMPLVPGVTYYWRVDEIEADGTTLQGPVWKFMGQPTKDYQPTPADGAKGQPFGLTLSWKAGKDAVQHQLYFGSDVAAVTSGAASVDQGKVSTLTFSTPGLRASTTYYWRIDVVKADKSVVQGDVWSFTTADAGPANKIECQVWLNIGAGTAVTDLTTNTRFPGSPDTTQFLDSWLFPPGSTGGSDCANNYGDREFGWLKPDQTGDYTFWIAGDDLCELWLSTDGSPANVKLIAQVTGWTNAMDWDNTTGGATTVALLKSSPIHLVAGQKYYILSLHKESGGGDSVGVAWQGGAITARTLLSAKYVDVFFLPPLQAFNPSPADGAVSVAQSTVLGWSAGDQALTHDVYLGTDKAAVAAADTKSPLYQGQQSTPSFSATNLAWGTTYYWRVDEVNPGEAGSPWKGPVWSFTTASFLPVDDMESYNDADNRIYDTWIDGMTDGLSGSTVGNLVAPFAELTIVHGGKQAMPMDFNNTKTPFYSEATQTFSPTQDWTVNGVTNLSLWFRGQAIAFADKGGNAYTVSGSGNDIWNAADAFRFVYKSLNGNGSITARVDSLTRSDAWSKAGVMIRETLDTAAKNAAIVMSSDNGASFQWRPASAGASSNAALTGIAAPYWVRITRTGNVFKGEVSADGKTWTQVGTDTTITMTTTVYIGLCVTAHNAALTSTGEFSNVTTSGTGAWQVAAIGTDPEPANSAAPLYATVVDSAGKSAMVVNANPAAINVTAYTQWNIPLNSLTGVNLGKVKSLTIGVGDRKNPVADGSGRVYIDDIQVTK